MSNVPSTGAVISTLIGITWKRLLRGRALWICAAIAGLPILLAVALRSEKGATIEGVAVIQLIVTALLSSVFVASAIGEEIEERTITYLWSRPLARWTIIAGKVLALAPISLVLTLGGWFLASQVLGQMPETRPILGFAAGAVTTAMVAAGIATLVPRQGMALSIIYLVIVDTAIGVIPASIHEIAISYQVICLTGFGKSGQGPVHAAIALAVIGVVWLTIGVLRIRRLES